MTSARSRSSSRPAARIPRLAWLAVLVLALGLPRLMVVCVCADHQAVVEFAHEPGHRGHGAGSGPDDGREPGCELGGDECHDWLLPFGVGPVPEPGPEGSAAVAIAAPVPLDAVLPAPTPGPSSLPSTGPPRPPAAILHKATTVLLL
ncbi:MAG: hypothetical protein IPM29_28645 [Planctomycetes bacterium]|nr:hypothetical protein [Planctomycetota bacterium]